MIAALTSQSAINCKQIFGGIFTKKIGLWNFIVWARKLPRFKHVPHLFLYLCSPQTTKIRE